MRLGRAHLLFFPVALAFTIGLASAAYMGSFMRLSGDDYCFGAVVADHGFLGAQVYSYTDQPPYHGDRYSTTFAAGLAILGGPTVWAGWTALTLIAWLAAAMWAIWLAASWRRTKAPLVTAYAVAAMSVFLTIYQAPDRTQSLYWWSANMLYLTPLIFQWVVVGLVVWQARTARAALATRVAACLLAFVAGGFSEAVAAFQVTWISVSLVAVVVLARRAGSERHRLVAGLLAAGLGAVLSLVALAASPFARSAVEVLDEAQPLAVMLVALRGGIGLLRETLQGLPLPTLVTLALGAMVGAVVGRETEPPRVTAWRWAATVVVVLGVSVLLSAAVLAPSLYAYQALPNGRALLAARHGMVLAFLAIGLVTGRTLAAAAAPTRYGWWLRLASASGLVVLACYGLYGARQLALEAPLYRRWARAWDARHAAILDPRSRGERAVRVTEIDHIIPGVSELTADPRYWYNRCAADYYRVESIIALPDG